MVLLVHRARQVSALLKRDGVWGALRAIWRRLRYGPAQPQYVDVFGHYSFALPHVIRPAPGQSEPGTLLWFIPDFNIGSGGHTTIFRTIWHLEQKGYRSGIVICKPVMHQNAQDARAEIQEHFFPLQAQVYLGFAGLPPCEFAMATGWDTAYSVRAFTGARHKLYFVQDFEPYFYAMGSEHVLAENTYRFGFFGITAGDWLAGKLAQDYGMVTHPVRFGVEQERYRRRPRREPHIRRVFFYARPPTQRRAFELGLLVLKAVWERLPDTHFIMAGWDTSNYSIPFPHLSCGTVTPDELADVFSQCDVALVLSLTNASLMPPELMACGCTVVSNRGLNVEWLLSEDVAVLTDATPEAMTDAVCGLLQDDARRSALSARGEAYARDLHWADMADQFEAGLQKVRAGSALS